MYVLAAWFNLHIPKTGVEMHPMPRNALALLPDFWRCNALLWRDRLGQVSLASTTLFWGVSGNMRYIVLAWAGAALAYGTTQAASLVGVVALGTAAGAVLASVRVRLDKAPGVIPLGIVMGLLVGAMVFVRHLWVAVPFLIALGALGGYIVVPMNALLQHRGHNLMGAGRSIAVQNFNEQACILGLGGLYSLAMGADMSVFLALGLFGGLVAAVMLGIWLWHARNLRCHGSEVQRLLQAARSDRHSSHGGQGQ